MSKARILGITMLAAAGLGGLVWAFWPEPVAVDMVEARSGPLRVTVAAEGVTRVRNPFHVTAPITGTASRSPVQVGDTVLRDTTVVATIQPAEPAFLDARARAEAEAAVTEAQAAVRLAQANLLRAQADLAYAESQLARNRELAARGAIPQRALEDTQQQVESQRAALAAAESELEMRRATLARTEAHLMGPSAPAPEAEPGSCCIDIPAPLSGTVLAVSETSARLVQAGERLLTIGDLRDLEIEVDLLSSDAVRLAPGAPALIERWGRDGALNARLRRIDPQGFTRISALGIEEQRVRVYLDFTDPPETRRGLGDAFRIFARIVVEEAEDTLQIPVSALFRDGDDWAVFRVEDDRALLARVETGLRTQSDVEILSGLTAGDQVIAYPGDRISEGVRVIARNARR
ncbi:efflux RND transporter periplasmic adaptor subunit [Alkalilacustris brevis]|uniref:efflux RND transporter periplasmic adaptor subunit n=1 Tax=Alkalilacustris brevis TaxID=2026338 RepID=UPI000E0DDA81|nr:HlyD family efflux transporter periplasmic adaptor subunit [Alkalilacustris brevis]